MYINNNMSISRYLIIIITIIIVNIIIIQFLYDHSLYLCPKRHSIPYIVHYVALVKVIYRTYRVSFGMKTIYICVCVCVCVKWNDNHWRTHFSSFLAILPLFCSRVLSRCSSSSSALRNTAGSKVRGQGFREQEVTWYRRETGRETADTGLYTEAGCHGNGRHATCEWSGGAPGEQIWPLTPCSMSPYWLISVSLYGCVCDCVCETYCFSCASRSLTSASRLLTSMTSSSSSSCSLLFWASVFCQSGEERED